jgi:hypothetical protein
MSQRRSVSSTRSSKSVNNPIFQNKVTPTTNSRLKNAAKRVFQEEKEYDYQSYLTNTSNSFFL